MDPRHPIFVNRTQPPESDEEDLLERRRRIDASNRLEYERNRPHLQEPMQMMRNQAFIMAGVNSDNEYDMNSPTRTRMGFVPLDNHIDDHNRTYRPVPDGKSVRLPHVDNRRTLVRPADPEEYYYNQQYSTVQRPLRHHPADQLVRDALHPSLGRYMDPQVVEVARREMAEAFELDERHLSDAAYTLSNPSYLEHVGGVHPDEINDFNQYSQQSLLRPSQHQPHTLNNQYTTGSSNDGDLQFVTTL